MSQNDLTSDDARKIVDAIAHSIDTSDLTDALPEGFTWEFDEVDFGSGGIGEFFIRGYADEDYDTGVHISLRVTKIEYGGSSLTFTGYKD